MHRKKEDAMRKLIVSVMITGAVAVPLVAAPAAQAHDCDWHVAALSVLDSVPHDGGDPGHLPYDVACTVDNLTP
jgi:hypothetical protein